MTAPPARGSRGEQTRAAILDAALDLFEEVGYEGTTMRAIAERAGVSVGNAYYYFDSKEQLIQGFYDRVAQQHLAASVERLEGVTDLAERIHTHLACWIELLAGFHEFAAGFFRSAADPLSPLSPFSADSARARDAAVERWRDVVEGADADLPDELRAELPGLLWLFHMGVILFWVHDRSPDQLATRLLAARLVPVVVRTVQLADVPEARAIVDDVLALIRDARTLLATDR